MSTILNLINELDPIWMLVLIGILTSVGSCMVGSDRSLRQWGNRLAAGGFVAYAIYAIQAFEPRTADQFVAVSIKSLFFSGLVLGCSWVCLGVFGFLYEIGAQSEHKRKEAIRRREGEHREREQERLRVIRMEEASRQKQAPEPEIPRAERFRHSMQEAREMYRQELEAIRAAQLKRAERRTVREDAKRRYLKRIRESLDG